jgi:anti-anti-sigma factor
VCSRHVEAGVGIVTMTGELDLATVDAARDAIRRASDEADHVICDLGAVWFIDVSGVHVLVDAAIQAREDGTWFAVANCPPIVPRMLGVLRLHDTLEILSVSRSPAPPPDVGPRADTGRMRLVQEPGDL